MKRATQCFPPEDPLFGNKMVIFSAREFKGESIIFDMYNISYNMSSKKPMRLFDKKINLEFRHFGQP